MDKVRAHPSPPARSVDRSYPTVRLSDLTLARRRKHLLLE